MIIIAMQSFPIDQTKEMAKRFAEQPELPSFITRKGPYFHSVLGGGIKSVNLYEFDQTRMAEALNAVNARMVSYYGVPGMTYSVDLWSEVTEALKLIGLG